MKPVGMEEEGLSRLLSDALSAFSFDLSRKQRDQLLAYATLLKQSPRHSFASWDSDDLGMRIHFRDSFLTIPKRTPERFLDLGSGAGIPGIIYSILWPGAAGVLLDSQKKRCEFLNDCLIKLELQKRVDVICGRAEEKAKDPALREKFDLVTARALAAFPQFLEYAVGFVRVGGFLHAIRGAKDSDAMAEYSALLKAFRLDSADQNVYQLNPDDPASRWIFLLKKSAPCPSGIPRNSRQIGKKLHESFFG